MSNWIEKVADIIAVMSRIKIYEKNILAFKNQIAVEILSHAPVIDAEKLDCLEEIREHLLTTIEQFGDQQEAINDLIYMRDAIDKVLFDENGKPKPSNLDLSINWVDGNAKWGKFDLRVREWDGNAEKSEQKYEWFISCNEQQIDESEAFDPYDTQALAEAACVGALKRIVTGQKDKE